VIVIVTTCHGEVDTEPEAMKRLTSHEVDFFSFGIQRLFSSEIHQFPERF
jgi:hypothetical protein